MNLRLILVLGFLCLVLPGFDPFARQLAAQSLDDATIGLKVDEARLRALRIRKITSKHLSLFTDLPASKEVDELGKVFDQAVKDWQLFFQITDVKAFHATGFLIKEKDRFVSAGVVPRGVPEFKNGYTLGIKTFWMYDQPSHYMRRQLMIHEGTHTFLFSHFGSSIPPWFNEGLAELFACHEWKDAKLRTRITIQHRDEAPFWGRTKLIREKIVAGSALTFGEIRELPATSFLQVEPYAWAWAVSDFLDKHPTYGPRFQKMARSLKDSVEFDTEFKKAFVDAAPNLTEEWRAYLADLDYGVNSNNSGITYQPAKQAQNELRVIKANTSWQNSGIKVDADTTYLIRAKGRFVIRESSDAGKKIAWPCEPNGITLEYYRGQPLGKLMMVIKPNDAESQTDFSTPLAVGLSRKIKAPTSGTIFFRVNESPAGLNDNSGEFLVSVVERK